MTHTLVGSQRPERNPLELVFCAFLALTILPVALGVEPLPGSLAKVPTPFGQLAAILICAGSIGVVVGILWYARDLGLLIQQAAMWFLSIGLLFYGAAVLDASGWEAGRLPIGLSFAFALGALARVGQFQLYVHHRKQATDS